MEERKGMHPLPLMMITIIAVIIFALIGIGDLMGWLPTSRLLSQAHIEFSKSEPHGKTQLSAAGCQYCGVIESIQAASVQGKSSGMGAIAGGVIGGILGHQIGGGAGKDLATIGGAAGGVYLGNEVEKNAKQHATFRITIRMDDGTHRTLFNSTQNFNIGQKVRVLNGRIIPVSNS